MNSEFGPEGIEAIRYEQKERAKAILRDFKAFVVSNNLNLQHLQKNEKKNC